MAFLNDRVLDNGLSVLTNEVNALHICDAEPADYAAATSTNSLGSKSSPTVGSPGARSPDGRKVTVSAISDGSVSADGTATHYALVDTSNSRLLAASTLEESQAVTSGNPFSLDAFDVGIPAAA